MNSISDNDDNDENDNNDYGHGIGNAKDDDDSILQYETKLPIIFS